MLSFPKFLFKKLLSIFGYQLTRAPSPNRVDLMDWEVGYEFEKELLDAIPLVRNSTMLSYGRLATLYQQAVFCERAGIQGSFVECGTWKGGAVGLMALANLKHGKSRRDLHLFDSFEGICEPDARVDGALAVQQAAQAGSKSEGKLKPMTDFYDKFGMETGTLAHNQKLLREVIQYPEGAVHYHKGWFQDTLPLSAKAVGPIAILRLDGDWYASTKVCLEHLYGQVVSGGFIIIDDYGLYDGCRKATDEFIASLGQPIFLHHVDASARYWIKENLK